VEEPYRLTPFTALEWLPFSKLVVLNLETECIGLFELEIVFIALTMEPEGLISFLTSELDATFILPIFLSVAIFELVLKIFLFANEFLEEESSLAYLKGDFDSLSLEFKFSDGFEVFLKL
jgi:hypothetical protein